MKRFARFLSALLIASLAYATVSEAACATESLITSGVTDLANPADTGPDSPLPPDLGHSCSHGHHHIDPLPLFTAEQALLAEASVKGRFHVAQLKKLRSVSSLERPPRA